MIYDIRKISGLLQDIDTSIDSALEVSKLSKYHIGVYIIVLSETLFLLQASSVTHYQNSL